jgi:hypothetical protein
MDTPTSAFHDALSEFKFHHTTGHRYLGGFVGSGHDEANWIDLQINQWVDGVKALSMVARRFPQTAYAGFAKSLQAEWQYVQRVTPNLHQAFAPLELAIAQIFLPALLNSTVDEIAKLRPLIALPVRHGGLGILDPTKKKLKLFYIADGFKLYILLDMPQESHSAGYFGIRGPREAGTTLGGGCLGVSLPV